MASMQYNLLSVGSSTADWSYADVPDQSGKRILITGANVGLGFALVSDFLMYTKCEKVILACRSEEKAKAAMEELGSDPRLEFLRLDLADIDQVREAAAELAKRYDRLDTLVLNAGCLNPDTKTETKQGFETTIGVCQFGHFVFTARVWPLLMKATAARIVPVASVGHEWTKTGLDLEDLNWKTRKYDGMEAYLQAKLANIYFQKELARRCNAAGLKSVTVISLSPGFGGSELYRGAGCAKCLISCVSEKCEKLSINTMRAATDETLQTGDYLNPKRMKFYGPPVVSSTTELANDERIAAEFWAKTEALTGETFDVTMKRIVK